MFAATIEQLAKEMKGHPITLICVLGLLAFAWYAGTSHARASDVDQKYSELQAAVVLNTTALNSILKLQLAEAMRSAQQQSCSLSPGRERRDMVRTIGLLQEDYQKVNNGESYSVPPCEAFQ